MKNIHHLMVLLCASSTLIAATTPSKPTTDASIIARTITKHIKETTDASYHALQKELKADYKQEHAGAKKEMRAAQKKLQDACAEEKKALQEACNAKKRALYDQYLTTHGDEQAAHTAQGKLLKALRNAALFAAKTLKAVFTSAQEYLEALITHGEKTHAADLIKTAHEELTWLDTLEKATRKSGISFDEEIASRSSAKKKSASQKQTD